MIEINHLMALMEPVYRMARARIAKRNEPETTPIGIGAVVSDFRQEPPREIPLSLYGHPPIVERFYKSQR